LGSVTSWELSLSLPKLDQLSPPDPELTSKGKMFFLCRNLISCKNVGKVKYVPEKRGKKANGLVPIGYVTSSPSKKSFQDLRHKAFPVGNTSVQQNNT
jgi:hypothetical protein